MQHHTQSDPLATESFPTDPSGLPEAGRPQLLELAPGDTLDLGVGPVAKRLGDTTVRMLGYSRRARCRPADLHAPYHPHQRPSPVGVHRIAAACGIEGSAQRRRAPVGVRRPSKNQHPLACLLA